jgi:hypothetical protein
VQPYDLIQIRNLRMTRHDKTGRHTRDSRYLRSDRPVRSLCFVQILCSMCSRPLLSPLSALPCSSPACSCARKYELQPRILLLLLLRPVERHPAADKCACASTRARHKTELRKRWWWCCLWMPIGASDEGCSTCWPLASRSATLIPAAPASRSSRRPFFRLNLTCKRAGPGVDPPSRVGPCAREGGRDHF